MMPLERPITDDLATSAGHNVADAPREGCPPPLQCRDIAAAFDATASTWELQPSILGTHGWCWGLGEPIYFLNGYGGSARLSILTGWLLHDQYRCMLIDWRPNSHGNTPGVDAFADELCRTIADAGDEHVTIVASSFGSAVALSAAAKAPKLVGRLVLQGVALQRRLSIAEWLLMRLGRRSQRPVHRLPGWEAIQTINHRRWFPPLDPDRWRWFLETLGESPTLLVALQADATHRWDLTHDAASVCCPVLLVDTEGAGVRGRAAQAAVREHLREGFVTSLHTTGMYPQVTHPHRLAKLIRQFIAAPTSFSGAGAEPELISLSPRP